MRKDLSLREGGASYQVVGKAHTPTGGSSGESCTMDESLMQQFRVKDEALRCVNFFFGGRRMTVLQE